MEEFIYNCKEQFDVVIFDSPAAALASESVSIGSNVDGIVLVIKAGSTKRDDVLLTKESIEYAGGNIVGVALNFSYIDKMAQKKYFRN